MSSAAILLSSLRGKWGINEVAICWQGNIFSYFKQQKLSPVGYPGRLPWISSLYICIQECPYIVFTLKAFSKIVADDILFFFIIYHIQSNYCTYPYKRTVKKFRCLQITASVLFLYFFIKAYVVGTHLYCIDLSMQFK